MRVWEYASKQVCKYTQDKFMKALGEVSSHCEIFLLGFIQFKAKIWLSEGAFTKEEIII